MFFGVLRVEELINCRVASGGFVFGSHGAAGRTVWAVATRSCPSAFGVAGGHPSPEEPYTRKAQAVDGTHRTLVWTYGTHSSF